MSASRKRLASRRFLPWVVLPCAAGIVVALGILGVGHGGPSSTNLDMRWLYLAGLYWHRGISAYAPTFSGPVDPWLSEAVARYDFAYPPQVAPLCLLLAACSPACARALMTAINTGAAVVLAAFSVRLAREPERRDALASRADSVWLVPALILGNPATAFVIWAGQTTLIVTAALVLGWYYSRQGRWLVGGLLLAVSTVKPQLSLLAMLWLALERRWLVLGAVGIGIVTLAAVPMAVSGPLDVFSEWAAAMRAYVSGPYNVLGSRMVFGLRNLLYAAGIDAPNLLPVPIVLCGILWHFRSSVADEDLLPILVSLALLFGFAHSYDIAALAPLVPAFWRHVHTRPAASLCALGSMLIVTFPNSLLEPYASQWLFHVRVLALSAVLCWLVLLSAKQAARQHMSGAGEILNAV